MNTQREAIIEDQMPTSDEALDSDLDAFFADEQSSEAALADAILRSFAKSAFDQVKRDFLPEGRLQTLVTHDSIHDELSKDAKYCKMASKWRDQFVLWILEKAPRLFIITLQCDLKPDLLYPCMGAFKRYNFNDSCLPLIDPRPYNPKEPEPPEHVFKFASKVWKEITLKKFLSEQWTCLSPVFTPDTYDYDLPAESIFPFTWVSTIQKGGAFSTVYQATIHKDHQMHPGLQNIALKQLEAPPGERLGADNAWDLEAGALRAINKLNHDHIVKCIAAIRRGGGRYFMFPWADGDSLRDYWETAPRQPPSAGVILEIVQQLRGLADALHQLHNFDGGHSTGDRNQIGGIIKARNPTIPDVQLPDGDTEVGDYENADRKASIRHGDVKPENILRFIDRKKQLGILKLADMGLAKRHVFATQVRRDKRKDTSTRHGTRFYEAPETVTESARSRLYDIWSMGCITLEFIIWVLYGNDELNNFYIHIAGGHQQPYQYYEIPEATEPNRAQVHRVVRHWMGHIQKNDPECSQNTAISDLLKIVRERLLIVPLPPDRHSTMGSRPMLAPPALGEKVTRYRATAEEFRDALDNILRKSNRPGYLLVGSDRNGVRLPKPLLSTADARNGTLPILGLSPLQTPMLSGVLGRTIGPDYSLPPMKDWQFNVDNVFAERVAEQIGADTLMPKLVSNSTLCDRCSKLSFWTGGFAIEDTMSRLSKSALNCRFCRLLRDARPKDNQLSGELIRFVRNQSNLVLAEDTFPALSIFRAPDSRRALSMFQLGFPDLPVPGSDPFFEILNCWLKDCDANHRDSKVHDCRRTGADFLPTRLIDVGSIEVPRLRLIETREESVWSRDYIALSHPWGDPAKYTPFTTLRNDPEGRDITKFKEAIPYDQLPATFKDAVDCTRRLGVRYLWIDSLCIIQGEDGDFTEEAKTMGNVFSGAYCVLAASRAQDQRDGFLGPRDRREFVTFQHNQEQFYVCQPIDNFNRHVIEGSLNRRGWVLQERALARRTIYFTATQTYFECGGGIRCETLTKMHNNMADFLGDPRFPEKAMGVKSKALRIEYFQGLYKLYSRLDFTRYEDRPFAIAGLEKSLQGAFETKGGFGIFDDGDKPDGGLFHRSLLWKRSEEDDNNPRKGKETDINWLTRIDFPAKLNIRVPSWSWMAYKGAIDYTDPHYQTADWETKDIIPPWTRGGIANTDSAPRDGEVAITATVRDFTVAGRQSGQVNLTYDTGQTTASDGQRAQCVVVARSKEPKDDPRKMFFVLLVAPTQAATGRGGKVYQRLGAGFMLGKFIKLDESGTLAKIV